MNIGNHKTEIAKAFYNSVESKEKFYIWGVRELQLAVNEQIPSNRHITVLQLAKYIGSFQKRYRVFRTTPTMKESRKYIFVERKK